MDGQVSLLAPPLGLTSTTLGTGFSPKFSTKKATHFHGWPGVAFSSSSWARTKDPLINSQML